MGAAVTDAGDVKHIGIVLFADVEELDAVGPWEVLSAWTRFFPQDGYAVSCLSRSGGLVQCAKGLTVSGVSAGIDMALHLIVRLVGVDRAREVRRYIQYDPAPPV